MVLHHEIMEAQAFARKPISAVTPPPAWWEWVGLAVAMLLFAGQALYASPQKSATFDEQYHLAAGYAYLHTGDFRLATTHPPLMGLLAALGLLGRDGIALPLDDPAWAAGDRFRFSDVFLWEANDDGPGMIVAARRPIILVGMWLVPVVALWARRLLGRYAAWLACLLVTFEPSLVANARVITTDLGVTFFLTLAAWQLWRWLQRPSALNLALTGVAAGLAMGAKYNGLLFWVGAIVVLALHPRLGADERRGRRWLGLLGIGVVALAVLWALYHFEFGAVRVGPVTLYLPAAFYWQQLWDTFYTIENTSAERLDFLLGQVSAAGWWYYFPVAVAIKTPLALLILGIAGGATMVWQRQVRRLAAVWVWPLLFLVMGLTGVLTIGFRHMLPALPFAIIMAANSVTAIRPAWDGEEGARRRSVGRWATVAVGALSAWFVLSSLRVYPHQESYFNELAGRWSNWSNLLVDSNLDWGQDLPALKEVMAERGIELVNLAYFGKAVPEKYGVHYAPLPSYLRFIEGIELNAYNPYSPEPGWYAISATELQLGLTLPGSEQLYAFFRGRRPDARAGYSIYLYHVVDAPGTEITRRIVSRTPVPAVSAQELGVQPGRRVQAKWKRDGDTEIYPMGEAFALSGAGYHVVGANFAAVFTLLGYTLGMRAVAGDEADMTLYWEKGLAAMPMPAPARGAPVAAFVHVVDGAGGTVAQYDGWETALRGLEPGDVIVQKIDVPIAAGVAAGEYAMIAGLYSPQNGERLRIGGGTGADSVELGTLDIK